MAALLPPSVTEMGAVLGFSVEELDLNRSGVVSSRQLWHLCFTEAAGTSFVVLTAAAIAILCVAKWKTTSAPMKIMPALYCVFAAIFGGWAARDIVTNVVTRKVSAAEGPLQFEANGRGARMIVGSFKGGAPVGAYKVLTEGATYRVYYMAHSDDFLSIEPIDSSKSSTVP